MGLDNPLHIAFLVIILLLVFGAKRLPELGRSLGSGMREFRQSITGEGQSQQPQPPALSSGQQAQPLQQQPVQPQQMQQPVQAQPLQQQPPPPAGAAPPAPAPPVPDQVPVAQGVAQQGAPVEQQS